MGINDARDRPIQQCNCYRALSLSEPILDTTKISNFEDRYFLKERLGCGKFGVIRRCHDKLTGDVLACKSIAKDRLVTEDDVCSVKLEIEIMTKLSGHPNVVDLKAVYEEEDYVHLVMELCAGGELFHRLEESGRFSEAEARVLFKHLMQVVLYCHEKGVVHRDLKPENILLASMSSTSPIKLADFGLATYIKPGQSLHGTVGSPFYIAPEVLAGGYNQAADVWSAGSILYILLSGIPPFWGKTKSKIFDAVRAADLRFHPEIWDNISLAAKDLITGMLCVDPSRRLTAGEVLDHSWIKEYVQIAHDPHQHDNVSCGQLAVDAFPLSSLVISRNQDYSFSLAGVDDSPVFTCKSSFSSLLVDFSTPSSVTGCFSFKSCSGPNAPEFSSSLPSFPSFTFFSPCTAIKQGSNSLHSSDSLSGLNTVHGESNLEKLFVLPEISLSSRHEAGESEHRTEFRRAGNGGSRVSGTRSRRNHTIGLGEFDQLDLIVTESIIRWASCTDISRAPSLRSSLVC